MQSCLICMHAILGTFFCREIHAACDLWAHKAGCGVCVHLPKRNGTVLLRVPISCAHLSKKPLLNHPMLHNSKHMIRPCESICSHHASLSMHCSEQCCFLFVCHNGAITQHVYHSRSSLCPRKPRISTDSAEYCASSVWFDESSLALTGPFEDDLLWKCPGLKATWSVCLLTRAAVAAVVPAAAGAGESAGGMLTARTESQGTLSRRVCSSG